MPIYANVPRAGDDPDPDARAAGRGLPSWSLCAKALCAMADVGIDEFFELGGKVLGPMVKRTAPDVNVRSIVTIEDVEALAKEIA